jgi:hypothetical protein
MTIERFIAFVKQQCETEQESERRKTYQAVRDSLSNYAGSKRDIRKIIIAWLEQALRKSRGTQSDEAEAQLSAAQASAH